MLNHIIQKILEYDCVSLYNIHFMIIRAFILFEDCFEVNKKLPGYWLATEENVSNESDCQKRCQLNADCTTFVYTTDSERCALKKLPVTSNVIENVVLKEEVGKIFGPKYCPGK